MFLPNHGCWMLLALLFPSVTLSKSANRPHIILIVADDLGWDDVSFHGSEISTPNIDSLAMEGIVLNNYYVQPICTPTRSTLMTGRHPIHTGLQHGTISAPLPYGLPLNETIMPQYLKKLGYSTQMIGKWHLGFFKKDYMPTYRGFDHHVGYLGGKEDYYNHVEVEVRSLANSTVKKFTGVDFRRDLDPVLTTNDSYSTEMYALEAERVIRSHNQSQPLFLYLANQAVHVANSGDLLEAPQRYVDRFPHIQDHRRRTFAGMVSALDDSVGHVISVLNETEMLNNSIIVFTTDNGGPANGYDGNAACNYPLRGTKNTVWEGGVRGTGFVYSKLLQKSRYISNHMMHVSDWLPTLYHAAGGAPDITGIDGYNMWEALTTNGPSARQEILHNIDPIQNFSSLRYKDYKLVFGQISFKGRDDQWYTCTPPSEQITTRGRRIAPYNNAPGFPILVNCQTPGHVTVECNPVKSPCLFNVTADPCEYDNIAEKKPEVVEMLMQRIESYRQTAVPPLNQPADPESDPELHGGFWSPWR